MIEVPAARRPLDLVAGALLLAAASIVFAVLPLGSVLLGSPALHNVVFGVVSNLLFYFILARVWWLVAADGGPAALVGLSFGASLLGTVYNETWNTLITGRAFQVPLDAVAAVVHVAAGLLLAVALIRWNRVPDRLGWLLLIQTLLEAIEMYSGLGYVSFGFGSPSVVLWVVFLIGLAAASARDEHWRASVGAARQ